MTSSASTPVMLQPAIKQRISQLQHALVQHDLAAVIVPTSDPHLSEYVPEYWQARQWLSGFTGSAGTLLVTTEFAGLWADSRYWVQAADQLAGTGIELQKLSHDSGNHIDWLAAHLSTGECVAIDGNVLSVSGLDKLENQLQPLGIEVVTEIDVVNDVWHDRPALPSAPIYAHDAQFVDTLAIDKLAAVRHQMHAVSASHHLISSLDDIAWLTNLRGSDVDYNPVFVAHLLITATEATVYLDSSKINEKIQAQLDAASIAIADYTDIQTELSQLNQDNRLWIDPDKVAIGTLAQLADNVSIIERIAPSSLLKSIKSAADIEHIREAMRQDGAALCAFFAQLEQRLQAGECLSELDIDAMLIAFRSQQPHYVSPSFPTIAGFNANGALPHYRATSDSFSYLDGDGLLLIDSGAQYQNGTTDITRVVGIGHVSDAQRRDFTLVLKAHIALAVACFPDGIASPLIDAICRAPLWAAQMDYGHGTGHGVGYFLNVHEGPQTISFASKVSDERAMRAGMITSNEPALYREGRWGIRIENLVANVAVNRPAETEFGDYLCFETLTLCPIDTRLILKSLLNASEIQWLNDYHQQVYEQLQSRVTGEAGQWLTQRTQPI